MDTLERLTSARIIPVVVVDDVAHAVPLARALVAGGIPVAEVTFRTAAAPDVIRAMAQEVPEILVGAGTVLNAGQVDQAADAGAQFIVSPGFLPSVVERAKERGLIVVPGAVTPSEIMAALEAGLSIVKFFPANVYGGVDAIAALGAPFGGVKFVPTGGVSSANLGEYLALPNVIAVGGTWMVKPALIRAGDFVAVENLSRDAVASIAN